MSMSYNMATYNQTFKLPYIHDIKVFELLARIWILGPSFDWYRSVKTMDMEKESTIDWLMVFNFHQPTAKLPWPVFKSSS